MRWGVLWAFIPDEALPLIVMGIGLALVLGLLTGRGAVAILVVLLLLPVLAPFVEVLFGALPPWVSLVVLAFIGLAILRGLVALVIGPGAADTMIGTLAADLLRFSVVLLLFPLRAARWTFRLFDR